MDPSDSLKRAKRAKEHPERECFATAIEQLCLLLNDVDIKNECGSAVADTVEATSIWLQVADKSRESRGTWQLVGPSSMFGAAMAPWHMMMSWVPRLRREDEWQRLRTQWEKLQRQLTEILRILMGAAASRINSAVILGDNAFIVESLKKLPVLALWRSDVSSETILHRVICCEKMAEAEKLRMLDNIRQAIENSTGIGAQNLADVLNATDQLHQTPLDLACLPAYESYDIARLLVFGGADPGRYEYSLVASHQSADETNLGIIASILDNWTLGSDGVPLGNWSNWGFVPIPKSFILVSKAAISIIENSKAAIGALGDVPAKHGEEVTELPLLCRVVLRRQFELANLLLEANANVNITTAEGNTPLHIAVQDSKPNIELVKLLLRYGADTGCYNDVLHTPETLAESAGTRASEMLEMLRGTAGRSKPFTVRPMNASQQAASSEFRGVVWQSSGEGGRGTFNTPTVLQMFYDPQAGRAMSTDKATGGDPTTYTLADNEATETHGSAEGSTAATVGDAAGKAAISETNIEQIRVDTKTPTPAGNETINTHGGAGGAASLAVGDAARKPVFSETSLKHLRPGSKRTTWVHLPANNRMWVQDAFTTLQSTDGKGEPWGEKRGPYDGKGEPSKSKEGGGTGGETETTAPATPAFRWLVEDIGVVRWSRMHYALQRPADFKVSPELGLKEDDSSRGSVISMTIPILDIDMQQPYYYKKRPEERILNTGESYHHGDQDTAEAEAGEGDVVKYTTDAGQPLTPDQQKHVDAMQDLGSAFLGLVEYSRSLDEYSHEAISSKALNSRNGDQTISRFIARQRVRLEPKPPYGRLPQQDRAEQAPANAPSRVGAGSSQKSSTRHAVWQLLSTVFSWLRFGSAGETQGQDPEAHRKRAPSTPETSFSVHPTPAQPATSEVSGQGRHDGHVSKRPVIRRQQIVVVPQLWLWKFGNSIITSFPERFDSTNSQKLSLTIMRRLRERFPPSEAQSVDGVVARAEAAKVEAIDLLEEIMRACLDFQPLISIAGKPYSIFDAFEAEIASVSSKVTTCYENFKKSLGKTNEYFSVDIKEEADHLLKIDDILNEINMIKRIHDEQDHVAALMHAHLKSTSQHAGPASPTRDTKSDWSAPVSPPVSPIATSPPVLPVTTQAFSRGKGGLAGTDDGMPDLRSPGSRHTLTRWKRLEEDAKRVRKSIVNLLDLQQQQVSTEDLLDGKAQSQVVFVFTVVTVIFAPLSLVSSIMALTATASHVTWASVVSVIVTAAFVFGTYLVWRPVMKFLDARNKTD